MEAGLNVILTGRTNTNLDKIRQEFENIITGNEQSVISDTSGQKLEIQ
jgi:short-subunit dehydrogenase involved in D-alanine esterification of teichoic acids